MSLLILRWYLGQASMKWVPQGDLFGQSNLLTGEGFFPLSSLSATGLNAPTDGVILWRFDLLITVEGFDPSIVWNAETAFADQVRGGRAIVRGGGGFGEEVFLNRAQTRVRNCWFYDADFAESGSGRVGTGDCTVRLSDFTIGARFVQEVYYGFEPSVTGRVRVEGDFMVLENPQDLWSFDLETN